MHRITLSVVLLTAVMLPLGCRSEDAADDLAPPPDANAIAPRLERLNEELLGRVQQGDAAGAAALYTRDALLLPPDGTIIRGRDAIRSFWAATAASTRIRRASSSATDVRYDGTLASLTGRYTLVTGPDDAAAVETRGTTLLVWRRTADGWRIHADMWTAEPPTP